MEKHELKKYKNILKQGLSIREASRILKIALTTIYHRLKNLRETGDIVHGNGIHQKRLIPLLHLDGVKNMQDANKYLENYIVEHNKRFSKHLCLVMLINLCLIMLNPLMMFVILLLNAP